MRKTRLVTILLIVGFILASRVASAFFGIFSSTSPRASQLSVIYLPHPSIVAGGARPLPTYDDLWTPERMVRDTRRIAAMGASRVVLAIDPRLALTDATHLDACVDFIGFAWQSGLQTTVLLGHPPGPLPQLTRAEQQRLVDWLKTLPAKISSPESLTLIEGRLLCLLPSAAPAWRVVDPALRFIRIKTNAALPFPSLNVDGKTWLFVPLPNRLPGYSPRNMEREFRRHLSLVEAEMGIDTLCIASWNDYANDAMVEPNTVDGGRLYEFLADWAADFIGQ